MFENRMLRRTFEPMRGEVTGEWRRPHNEKFCELYSSPNTNRVIKSRRITWAGHEARTGYRKVPYRVWVGKPSGKNQRPRPKLENNIKMYK